MEIASDVRWTGSGVYEFTEETSAEELVRILQRDAWSDCRADPES